jgi:integration host factor subunit beta
MTKSELIKALAKRYSNLPIERINIVVNTIFEQLSVALENGQRIELRGFGTFSVRKRASRIARNPKTNEVIKIGDRNVPYFRMGKEFRDRINSEGNA